MKRTLIALSVVCAAIVSAADFTLDLSTAKVGDSKVPGWNLNNMGNQKDPGKGEVVEGTEGKNALKITTVTRRTDFFRPASVKVNTGDTVKVTAKIKGNGRVGFGFYCYNEKGAFVSGVKGCEKYFDLTSEARTVEAELKVGTPKVGEVKSIRFCIAVPGGSEVVVEDVKFSAQNAQ